MPRKPPRRPMTRSSQSASLRSLAKSAPKALKKNSTKPSANSPCGDRNGRRRIALRIDLFHFFPYILSLISLYMLPQGDAEIRRSLAARLIIGCWM